MGKGIEGQWGQWVATNAEILQLHHFYRKSSDREFVEIMDAFGESPETITQIAFFHAEFCGEAAVSILDIFLSRKMNSDSNDVRYWAASELHKHQMLEFEFFRVFN